MSVVAPEPVDTFVHGPVDDGLLCQLNVIFVIGPFGLLALMAVVLPAQIGDAELIAEVVITGASGVPLQVAGTPSKPKSAVAVLAVPVELDALPYILPLRPVNVN